MTTQRIALVGAGLAGCECALQLARRGFAVTLFEQKPEAYSPAHSMPQLAELVCSNSLRSDELASGVGLIKQELRELGSALMAVADATRVPAGKALAVDRELFAGKVTELVEAEPNITLVRKAIADLDDPALEGFERVSSPPGRWRAKACRRPSHGPSVRSTSIFMMPSRPSWRRIPSIWASPFGVPATASRARAII